jgi:hypothetical protein
MAGNFTRQAKVPFLLKLALSLSSAASNMALDLGT